MHRKLAMAIYTDITPTLKSVETRRFLVLLAISLAPDVFERFYPFTYHVHTGIYKHHVLTPHTHTCMHIHHTQVFRSRSNTYI